MHSLHLRDRYLFSHLPAFYVILVGLFNSSFLIFTSLFYGFQEDAGRVVTMLRHDWAYRVKRMFAEDPDVLYASITLIFYL